MGKRRVGKSPRVILASQSLNSFSEDSPSRSIETQRPFVSCKVLGDHRRQSQQCRLELGCVSAVDANGEPSGLLTHIATTESVSLRVRMKS
jgi:hypothetical protein